MLKRGTLLDTIDNVYTVEAQINQGGNGYIYRVRDAAGQVFALKAIDREKTSSAKLKRFRNELRFCERNEYKHIIKVIDSGTYTNGDERVVFYVMPLYASTLRDKITSGLDRDEILPLFYQLLDALKFAHQKEVWHRDVKPENILINDSGTLILADFGIAHFCADEIATAIETRTTDRLANFTYAAPEQRIKGSMVDGRADIYAAGLILNEMYTGNVIAGANFDTIGSVAKEFAYLDDIISWMICQKPENRLYPVEKIAVQIASAQTTQESQQKLLQLTESPQDSTEIFQDIPIPKVIKHEYKDNALHLHLTGINRSYSQAWFDILKNGGYSRGSVLGYDTNRLQFRENTLIMSIRANESPNTVTNIARNIEKWIVPATNIFNAEMHREEQRIKQAEKQKIQNEINRLRSEEQIRQALNESF